LAASSSAADWTAFSLQSANTTDAPDSAKALAVASLLAESLEVIQQTASVILGALRPAVELGEGADQSIDEKPEFAEVA
jgi:hypothetical protein